MGKKPSDKLASNQALDTMKVNTIIGKNEKVKQSQNMDQASSTVSRSRPISKPQ